MDLRRRLKEGMLLLDGGTGTMLQRFGMPLGTIPETLNVEKPEWILRLHRGYLDAGSDLIYANTFGANRLKLVGTKYTVEELVGAAVRLARQAAEEAMTNASAAGSGNPAKAPAEIADTGKPAEAEAPAEIGGTGNPAEAEAPARAGTEKLRRKERPYVALDIGPLGQLLAPTGSLGFEEAYDLFSEIVEAGKDADLVVIETMTDLQETKAAVLAAKEHCSLPILVTMTFEENLRTFTGCSVPAMCLTLEGLGVDALGVNCSLGPKELLPIVEEISKWTALPIIVKPNAGLPDPVTNTYDITPEAFAKAVEKMLPFGPRVLGGCCGTDPSYIRELRALIDRQTKSENGISKGSRASGDGSVSADGGSFGLPRPLTLCSATRTVTVDRPRIIGERINPTGKKRFREALLSGDMDYILRQAIEQTEAGAEILDVNVGAPGVDEKEMMVRVVRALQAVTDVPLQLDSTKPEVLEAALRAYVGKPIINSVNGEQAVMDRILPLAAKYGAAVVGLTLDENGIPPRAEERFAIAERILREAEKYGIPRENVIIDCLVLTVSSEQRAARETLRAVRMVREKLGLNTCLGVSNISFGLPARGAVNTAFFTMALEAGLTLPIMNPNVSSMMWAYRAFLSLTAKDENSLEYITYAQGHQTDAEKLTQLRKEGADGAKVRALEAEIEELRKDRELLREGLGAITALSSRLSGRNFPEGTDAPAASAPANAFGGMMGAAGKAGSSSDSENAAGGGAGSSSGAGNAAEGDAKDLSGSGNAAEGGAESSSGAGNAAKRDVFASLLSRPADHQTDCGCERCRQVALLKGAFRKAGLLTKVPGLLEEAVPYGDGTGRGMGFDAAAGGDAEGARAAGVRALAEDKTIAAYAASGEKKAAPGEKAYTRAGGTKEGLSLETPAGAAILKAMETGMKSAGREETLRLLEAHDSMEIINGILIPALDAVGERFEKGKLFLPQLILAADVAKECFDAIKESMARKSPEEPSKAAGDSKMAAGADGTGIGSKEGSPDEKGSEAGSGAGGPEAGPAKAAGDSEIGQKKGSSDEKGSETGSGAGGPEAGPAKNAGGSPSRGRILLATVKGDIHDIGKNIVKVILENYGYDVLDLGRDVAPERIVEAVLEKKIPLVGLSALMTTTLGSMETTIRQLHEANAPCKIMVGGAVLTPEYAKKIGADYYAKDAKQGADIAKEVFGR